MIKIKHKNFRKKFMFHPWYTFLKPIFWLILISLFTAMSARPIIILHFLLCSTTASRMYYFSKSYICYLITTLMLIFLKISSVPILSPMIDLRWWEIGKLVEDTNFLLLLWTILSALWPSIVVVVSRDPMWRQFSTRLDVNSFFIKFQRSCKTTFCMWDPADDA